MRWKVKLPVRSELLQEVRQARIHLVLPKDELYSSEQKDATASVVVDLQPKAKLRLDQVRGIVFLVAASVEGLQPLNVTLVDSRGKCPFGSHPR